MLSLKAICDICLLRLYLHPSLESLSTTQWSEPAGAGTEAAGWDGLSSQRENWWRLIHSLNSRILQVDFPSDVAGDIVASGTAKG